MGVGGIAVAVAFIWNRLFHPKKDGDLEQQLLLQALFVHNDSDAEGRMKGVKALCWLLSLD